MFLNEVFDAAKQLHGENYFTSKTKSAEHIISNLSQNLTLRGYQEEAIGRLLHYTTDYPSQKKPTHLLFNMATGSGKTVILASTILHYASLGYRHFLFTTRLGSIVDKTVDNLLKSASSKYLFASHVEIGNQTLNIKRVKNFSDSSSSETISLYLETTAYLHSSLHNVSEGALSFDDFSDKKIVILADEAHNLSGQTLSKAEEEIEKRNWESTVSAIHSANPQNVLVEFTATARIEGGSESILAKYRDALIFKYTLKEMRNDGFSKNVSTLQLDAPLHLRVLSALVVSAYRENHAATLGVSLKPVILFKANRIKISDQTLDRETANPTYVGSHNFSNFFKRYLDSLSADDFHDLEQVATGQISHALSAISESDNYDALADQFRKLFSGENFLSVDDPKENRDTSSILNSLEDPGNRVRVVLATEKLNEGWDVLNLFDIVRLYDSRDAKGNKAGKNTVLEAQLIGRGARYFPFTLHDGSRSLTRRYDLEDENQDGILEQLYYHSMRNNRYIQELEQVLVEQGVMAEKTVQRSLYVKESIKSTPIWQGIHVLKNELISTSDVKPEMREAKLPERCRVIHVTLPTFESLERSIFQESSNTPPARNLVTLEINPIEIDRSLWIAALDKNPNGSFDALAHYLPGLSSRIEFIESTLYLAGATVLLNSGASAFVTLNRNQLFGIACLVINEVLARLVKTDRVGLGSRLFAKEKLESVFGSLKTLNFDPTNPRAAGRKEVPFETYDWYAQNEVWGTDQEYALVNFIGAKIQQIREVWDDALLIRNEGHMSIYDFESGQRFNPDFLLLVARTSNSGARFVKQIFIEPKGDQFLDANGEFAGGSEGWKESLLSQLATVGEVDQDVLQTTEVVGLPLFNNGSHNPHLFSRFQSAFEVALEL